MTIWTPESPKPHRRNVQISDLRVLVLIHKDTKRILCFGMDDKATRALARKVGCKIVEIMHAHEYDRWARIWSAQAAEDSAIDDHAYLERENATRVALRTQLKDRLALLSDGSQRQAVASALHCLETMENRRQRKRAESFLVQEGYEANKNVGEDLVNKIMVPTNGKEKR